jgi:hypothetical protein
LDYDSELDMTTALLKYAQREMLALSAISAKGGNAEVAPVSQLLQSVVF